MKILFLARRFWPDIGGVEKHVYEISKRLIEKGYEVTVVTESSGEVDQLKKIKIIRIPETPKNFSEKIHIWKWILKQFYLFRNANIVHAHDVYFSYWPLKLLFPSKKSFVTFHGYEDYPITKKALIVRKISEKWADGNIIVGDFIKKWYGTKPDFVIYGGSRDSKQDHSSQKSNFCYLHW